MSAARWTLSVAALLAQVGAAAASLATAHAATVPGTSNPWLAGMPPGSTAISRDSAPAQSPVLVSGVALAPGTVLTFRVTGSVSNTPAPSRQTPDGRNAIAHARGAENGIAALTAPGNSLIGLFLDDSQPDRSPAPKGLDFSALKTDFARLTPALKQPFFIGDGRTGMGAGEVQEFVVPAGATRLFLGTMDGYGWYNNSGAFEVTVGTPESGNRARP